MTFPIRGEGQVCNAVRRRGDDRIRNSGVALAPQLARALRAVEIVAPPHRAHVLAGQVQLLKPLIERGELFKQDVVDLLMATAINRRHAERTIGNTSGNENAPARAPQGHLIFRPHPLQALGRSNDYRAIEPPSN